MDRYNNMSPQVKALTCEKIRISEMGGGEKTYVRRRVLRPVCN